MSRKLALGTWTWGTVGREVRKVDSVTKNGFFCRECEV